MVIEDLGIIIGGCSFSVESFGDLGEPCISITSDFDSLGEPGNIWISCLGELGVFGSITIGSLGTFWVFVLRVFLVVGPLGDSFCNICFGSSEYLGTFSIVSFCNICFGSSEYLGTFSIVSFCKTGFGSSEYLGVLGPCSFSSPFCFKNSVQKDSISFVLLGNSLGTLGRFFRVFFGGFGELYISLVEDLGTFFSPVFCATTCSPIFSITGAIVTLPFMGTTALPSIRSFGSLYTRSK